jgi:hypothetical protein
VDGLKVLLEDLAKAEKDLTSAEDEIKKVAINPAKEAADKAPPVSVSANLGSSTTNGPPLSPSQRLATVRESQKGLDDKTVLINVPGLAKSDWNEAFARRFALLADNGDGNVVTKWQGDLLQLEVKPVVDPARYATKINFGKLIYYSRTDRIITLEFNPERVNNFKAQGDIITPIMIDLKQREKPAKINAALSQLNNYKVDPGRQAEVAAALEIIAIDGNLNATTRELAIKLIPNWSGRESAELLITLMDDKLESIRLSAIDALVETKSPKAAEALVKKWDKVEPTRITKALTTFGSEVEGIVLPYLNNTTNVTIRTEACKVLEEIGTAESLKPLLDIMNAKEQSPVLANAAKDAMKQILARKSK